MTDNKEILAHIKHNEWFLINHGLNLARLKAFRYYVDSNGERCYLSPSSIDTYYEYYVHQIESRAKSILALKDELTPERVTEDSSEFNVEP